MPTALIADGTRLPAFLAPLPALEAILGVAQPDGLSSGLPCAPVYPMPPEQAVVEEVPCPLGSPPNLLECPPLFLVTQQACPLDGPPPGLDGGASADVVAPTSLLSESEPPGLLMEPSQAQVFVYEKAALRNVPHMLDGRELLPSDTSIQQSAPVQAPSGSPPSLPKFAYAPHVSLVSQEVYPPKGPTPLMFDDWPIGDDMPLTAVKSLESTRAKPVGQTLGEALRLEATSSCAIGVTSTQATMPIYSDAEPPLEPESRASMARKGLDGFMPIGSDSVAVLSPAKPPALPRPGSAKCDSLGQCAKMCGPTTLPGWTDGMASDSHAAPEIERIATASVFTRPFSAKRLSAGRVSPGLFGGRRPGSAGGCRDPGAQPRPWSGHRMAARARAAASGVSFSPWLQTSSQSLWADEKAPTSGCQDGGPLALIVEPHVPPATGGPPTEIESGHGAATLPCSPDRCSRTALPRDSEEPPPRARRPLQPVSGTGADLATMDAGGAGAGARDASVRAALEDAFARWEVGGAGFIGEAELRAVLRVLCPSFSDEEVQRVVSAAEAQPGDAVGYTELLAFLYDGGSGRMPGP